MKIMKRYIAVGFAVFVTTICHGQADFKTLVKDFENISGSWHGSLTYLDYSSGRPYTMPANTEIKRIGKTNKFAMAYIYPNETNANSIDTVAISSDGKYIDNALVKSRRRLPNGDIEIITEEPGKDGNDNKPATVRHIYIAGKKIFKKRKEVQFVGATEWINRHEYAFTKKPGS